MLSKLKGLELALNVQFPLLRIDLQEKVFQNSPHVNHEIKTTARGFSAKGKQENKPQPCAKESDSIEYLTFLVGKLEAAYQAKNDGMNTSDIQALLFSSNPSRSEPSSHTSHSSTEHFKSRENTLGPTTSYQQERDHQSREGNSIEPQVIPNRRKTNF